MKPEWLRVELPDRKEFFWLKKRLRKSKLHTICEDAKCPNIGYCFSQKTSTFLILGDICTRNCSFCAVKKGKPLGPPSFDEILEITKLVKELKLDYVVITSVTRDDLEDGGANHYKNLTEYLRKKIKNIKIEILIPDFQNREKSLKIILNSPPDILNHNIETVKRLYPEIRRPENFYNRSLKVLKFYYENGLITKSGIMVGLGETLDEIKKTMEDLLNVGVKILTIGQYLQPTRKNHPVLKYYHPDEFEELKEIGEKMGFIDVVSGPFVRSSYKAKESYNKVKNVISNIQ